MPQQTKTEALEELARLIRRDILNGTAPLNGVWWFSDDTRLQDRIAHVLLDYSDEEKPTGASQRTKPEAPTLRIDTDMSDPQPGKLLVVRLDRYDVDNIRDKYDVSTTMSQWVGFLVETPAVECGAWVVVSHENDVPYYWSGYQWTDDISRAHRWGTHPENWKGAGRAVFMADLEVSE